MLRTRTNDMVEILEASKYFKKQNNGLYAFEGLTLDELFKYNIIHFSEEVEIDNGQVYIRKGSYFHLLDDGSDKVFVNFDGYKTIRLSIAYSNYFSVNRLGVVDEDRYENLVGVVPTDVRVVEDEGKLQLQLEHDSQVLSIDEGFNSELLTHSFTTLPRYKYDTLITPHYYTGQFDFFNLTGDRTNKTITGIIVTNGEISENLNMQNTLFINGYYVDNGVIHYVTIDDIRNISNTSERPMYDNGIYKTIDLDFELTSYNVTDMILLNRLEY